MAKQLSIKFEPYIAWSLLSDAPIIVYLPYHDEHYAVWNGTIMPYHVAMMVIASGTLNIFVSNAMRGACHEKTALMLRDLYDTPCDSDLHDPGKYLKYIYKRLHDTTGTFVQHRTPAECLGYMDLRLSNPI